MNTELDLPDVPEALRPIFDWFEERVRTLSDAYTGLEHRVAELDAQLERRNAELESLLDSLHDGVLMVDVEERITMVNGRASQLLGLDPLEAVGQNLSDVFPAQGDFTDPLQHSLHEGVPLRHVEVVWTRTQGTPLPLGLSTAAVIDPVGRRLGAVASFSDLTHLKQMERELSQTRTLAALGEMAATVAHEIRNPLAGIGGFAGLLERDLEGDDPRRALVKKIVQGVSSLNKIVSNLLVFTRHMELNVQKVDFVAWMEDILNYAEVEIAKENKDIAIERAYAFETIEARIDPEKLQQVFLNLLFNAIQAIEGKGAITIKADVDERDFLRVAVIDDGKGIPKDIQDKIFNPFFTTKEQGTGLGLAIVQRIILLHGGEITVASRPGETRFEISIDSRGSVHG